MQRSVNNKYADFDKENHPHKWTLYIEFMQQTDIY